MVDAFTAEDLANDPDHPGETLPQWLARKLGETPLDARARLAESARVRASLGTVEREVLTPEDVAEALSNAGWTALTAYRWRDPESGGSLPWPRALATTERRARSDGRAA